MSFPSLLTDNARQRVVSWSLLDLSVLVHLLLLSSKPDKCSMLGGIVEGQKMFLKVEF